MLGAGIQTALRAIERGYIGTPLTATTIFRMPGPDRWHPAPEFLCAEGAGPLFDIGPYYISTLLYAFGSVSQVHAVSSTARQTRVIGSGPRAGTEFAVEVPTHYGALISFAGGQSAQTTLSFQHALPREGFVEINGTEGTIVLPDPNKFGGNSRIWRFGANEPTTLESEGAMGGRGTGLVEMVHSIEAGRDERASGEIAAHTLDVLLGIRDAADSGLATPIHSRIERPSPLPESFDPTIPFLRTR